MQFCKVLGLIILFLPQIELYKKTKAHIIHTLGQDQVLLLSGKSWRIGEEICFPIKIIHYWGSDSMQRNHLWEQTRGEWKTSRSMSLMFLRAQEKHRVLVSLLSHSHWAIGHSIRPSQSKAIFVKCRHTYFYYCIMVEIVKITSVNTAFTFLLLVLEPGHFLKEWSIKECACLINSWIPNPWHVVGT